MLYKYIYLILTHNSSAIWQSQHKLAQRAPFLTYFESPSPTAAVLQLQTPVFDLKSATRSSKLNSVKCEDPIGRWGQSLRLRRSLASGIGNSD